jgi:hypothetical protein
MNFLRKIFGKKESKQPTRKKPTPQYRKETRQHPHVVQIDNRSPSDNSISNTTGMGITVACNQQQAGKFSVDLMPGQSKRVSSRIEAQPYPYGKQKYDEFQYELGVSETWEVHLDSERLVMRKV